MAGLPKEYEERLRIAHAAGCKTLKQAGVANGDIEDVEVILRVERHRWHWKPPKVRVLLIAESHVYTPQDDLGITLNYEGIFEALNDYPTPPKEFVNIIYCLGYGESELLGKRTWQSTWQFWNDIFGKITNRGKQPKKPERLIWKIDTLSMLQELGVWLIDASVHAIYLGKKAGSKKRLRRSLDCSRTLHRQWWEHLGGQLIDDLEKPHVWVVGKSAFNHLKEAGFPYNKFIYQPQALRKDALVISQNNLYWTDLMMDVHDR